MSQTKVTQKIIWDIYWGVWFFEFILYNRWGLFQSK